jgi:hypothetical protein
VTLNELGTQLVARLCSEKNAAVDGQLTNDLLKAFQRGYPIAQLRLLLEHEREDVAGAAAWIASELGSRASPVLDAVARLLITGTLRARFFALDAILVCATAENGKELASAIELTNDPESSIRWKAIQVASRMTIEQLHAAELELRKSHKALAIQVRWLADEDLADVESHIDNESDIVRLFGLIAALRCSRHNADLLIYASKSRDEYIRSLASRELKH